VFGLLVAYALASGVVYPRFIEPQLTIEERIAEREEDLAKLVEGEAEVERAKWAFRDYANRIGSFDVVEVENDLRDRLNSLIAKHGLEEASVTPRRPTSDKKIGLTRMTITVGAEGTLESCVLFLKDVAELPHVITLTDPVIYPLSSGRSKRRYGQPERMNLHVPIQVLVLSQQRLPGRIPSEELVQPERWVRHEAQDYSVIWTREPLSEPIKLEPLVVTVRKDDVSVEQGARVRLDASARGGDRQYKYSWDCEEVEDRTSPKAKLDTSTPGMFTCTVTVTDGTGATAEATVSVTIREKKQRTAEKRAPREPPEPPGPKREKDGKHMQVTMVWSRQDGASRVSEMMVYNSKSKETRYYEAGEDFDGGKLVFVHQTGALVRRQDGYFVYPIGAKLNEDIGVDDAVEYPRLQDAARRIREAEQSQPQAKTGPGEASASGPAASPKPEAPSKRRTTDTGRKRPGSTGARSKPVSGGEDAARAGSGPTGATPTQQAKPSSPDAKAAKKPAPRKPSRRPGVRSQPARGYRKQPKGKD
jgi:hypothetical protein